MPSVSPPLSPPETICQTPNKAISMARLRIQPGGSRIQAQAMMEAMNGARALDHQDQRDRRMLQRNDEGERSGSEAAGDDDARQAERLERRHGVAPIAHQQKQEQGDRGEEIRAPPPGSRRRPRYAARSARRCSSRNAAPRTRMAPLRCASSAPDIVLFPCNAGVEISRAGWWCGKRRCAWLICGWSKRWFRLQAALADSQPRCFRTSAHE